MNFCLKRKDYIYIHPNRKKGLGRERERGICNYPFSSYILSSLSPLSLPLHKNTQKQMFKGDKTISPCYIFVQELFYKVVYIYIFYNYDRI